MNRRIVLLICTGLVLAVIAAYEPVRHNGFVNFDDDIYVAENANIKDGLTPKAVAWAFISRHAGNWHPLTWLSHVFDYEFFGLEPFGHHATSVLLHIANTLLLFYVLWNMTGAVWKSVFVALLFAVHPLRVESVAWVSERKDVLSAFFGLLTMFAYIRYFRVPGFLRYAQVFILFALGLMAKPMLVTLPFVLLLLDYWPLKRPLKTNLLLEKVPLLILAVVSSAVTYAVQKSGDSVTQDEILPLGLRVSNAFVSYVSYIGKIIYPANLAVLYPHPQDGLALWKVISAGALLAAVTGCVLYAARKRPYLIVGWLWYLGMLVPVIGIVQVGHQAMADRYTYLPAVGIFIIVAWSAGELFGKSRPGRTGLAIVSALIISALLICTRIQTKFWRNSETLFSHALMVTKNNYRMHHALAYELISQGCLDEGIAHYRKSLEIAPANAEIHYNLANALRRQGEPEEAIEQYRLAIQYKNDYADAYNNLAYIFLAQSDFDGAKRHFIKALEINEEHSFALTGLAQVLLAHPDPNLRDPEMAAELAERAAVLTNNQNVTILHTLDTARRLRGTDKAVWAESLAFPGLPNFHKVSDDLYRGAQPTEEGMKQLEKLGIKTVVNLRSFHSDRDEIRDTDMDYVHIYMKPWRPEDKEVVKFLEIVMDPNRTPVFVHCRHGADRTGTMCAIYRIVVQGWSKNEAIEEMKKGGFGFHDIWVNLPDYIRDLDVEKIKQQAGKKTPVVDN